MADVTYNTSSFPALLRTLASLLAPSAAAHDGGEDDGVADDDADDDDDPGSPERDERGHDPLVLLAYKERDPAERQLWDMMHDDARDGHRARVYWEASRRGRAPCRDLVGEKKKIRRGEAGYMLK
jgi:hypothetical protein